MDSGPNQPPSLQHRTQRTGPSTSQRLETDGIGQSGQQRLEREELERRERERREQDMREQDRLEQERRQQDRLDQERREQERLEQEGREQERLEQERLEQERREQERLEQERLELRRIEERLEREDLQERLAQALQAQENLEQEKQRQQEREKRELDRQEAERQRQKRREQGRWELEKTIEPKGNLEPAQKRRTTPASGREPEAAETTRPRPRRRQNSTPLAQGEPDSIWITFKVRERGVWRTAQSLLVDSSDPSEVERIAVKYMREREQIRVYDTDLNILTQQMYFQAAIANRSNVLLLIPEREIDINEELEASVSQLLSESDSQKDDSIE